MTIRVRRPSRPDPAHRGLRGHLRCQGPGSSLSLAAGTVADEPAPGPIGVTAPALPRRRGKSRLGRKADARDRHRDAPDPDPPAELDSPPYASPTNRSSPVPMAGGPGHDGR